MGSIEERLDKVRELIQDEDFLVGKGLSNEVNIRVFCYEPEDEMAVRRFVEQMLAHPAVNIGGRGRVHQDIRYMRRKIQRVDVPTVYEHRCLRLGTTNTVNHQPFYGYRPSCQITVGAGTHIFNDSHDKPLFP